MGLGSHRSGRALLVNCWHFVHIGCIVLFLGVVVLVFVVFAASAAFFLELKLPLLFILSQLQQQLLLDHWASMTSPQMCLGVGIRATRYLLLLLSMMLLLHLQHVLTHLDFSKLTRLPWRR